MQINYDGAEYTLDLDELDVVEAKHIKRKTGMTLLQLQEGLEQVDPDALVALYWLMMKQSGVAMEMDRLNFKIVKFGNALQDAVDAEKAAQEEAGEDPKAPVT